jgi:hypothetical protein
MRKLSPVDLPKVAPSMMRAEINHGRAAIQRWKEQADAKYRYVLQPIGVRTEGDTTTVLARLTGDIPGSPVDLNHTFTISRNEIALLEIR